MTSANYAEVSNVAVPS
jgi:hypothetical protein